MLYPSFFKLATGAVVGATLLALVGPIVGELVATLPPLYFKQTPNPLSELGLYYRDVTFPTTTG